MLPTSAPLARVCAAWCRVCIIAGDISPIDVITHLPLLCEENAIPYIYIPSKEVRRPWPAVLHTICMPQMH
jgi:hypothetical protein